MDVLDRYLDLLASAANRCVEQGCTARDAMGLATTTPAVQELVDLRVQFLAPQDDARAAGLLDTGCFGEMSGNRRLAAFIVSFELDDEISKLDVFRRFQRYDPSQPLFERCPKLWSSVRNSELVATTHARHFRRTGLVELPSCWGRLDAFLSPDILQWVEGSFPGAPIFVRLDPWFVAAEQPPEPLREVAVRPARPNWLATLALRNREYDGGHYVLQRPVKASAVTADEYWEYNVRGVRSLEVHARRSAEGNLSLMLEELADDRRPDGRVIGRCIHLDTDSGIGTEAHVAVLNHIDLAINMYCGQAATRRRAMRLSDGRVADASVRSHLLRVEAVPFSSSVEFARQFFRSTVLWREWMRDQFGP